MPDKEESEYRVAHLKRVKEEIASLAVTATSLGMREEFLQTLKTIETQLRTRPLEWGDPERKTSKKGGLICHGVTPLLIAYYMVFESERAVCILSIKPFSGSQLE